MAGRSRDEIIVFAHDVVLSGHDCILREGSYRVRTEEEMLEGLSFVAFRRVATTLFVERGHGVTEAWTVDPAELEAALAHDRGGKPPATLTVR